MKIIGRSNYDLDTVDDILVAENVKPEYATQMANSLNLPKVGRDDYYFVVEPDDYKLKVWEP